MGAGQSKPDDDEKVFYSEIPIQVSASFSPIGQAHPRAQFSDDVVNDLSDHMAAPGTSPERQSTLDAHVRSRIQSELAHLRQEEEVVQSEIERALERENLDRERSMAGEEDPESAVGTTGSVKSSAALMGDLEEVRAKVERFHSKRELSEFADARTKSEAVVFCYKCVIYCCSGRAVALTVS